MPDRVKSPLRFRREYVLVALLALISVAIIVPFFERIPIEGTMLAIDWQSLYLGLKGGHVVYQGGSVMIAPWSLPAVLPLGFFSLRAGWGLLGVFTIAVLVASVPRQRGRIDLLGVILLVSSWQSLREIVDGNFEAIVILGLLLVIYAYRRQAVFAKIIGLLLATAKPQEVWLVMPVLGLYLLKTWSMRRKIQLGIGVAVVVIPALLLFGLAWLNAMSNISPPPGTVIDITLWAALHRLGVPSIIALILWISLFVATAYISLSGEATFSREKAGMLIAASLLLAPYAAGDSFLTVLAIGIIPLWRVRPRIGWILLIITDFQYLLNAFARDILYWQGAYFWTAMLIVVWGLWAWQFYQDEIKPKRIKETLN